MVLLHRVHRAAFDQAVRGRGALRLGGERRAGATGDATAGSDSDVTALARRIKCPTLVIHGDGDKRVPIEKGQAIRDLVPGAQLLTVGGGGHLPSARDPVMFNRAVRDFVAGRPREREPGCAR